MFIQNNNLPYPIDNRAHFITKLSEGSQFFDKVVNDIDSVDKDLLVEEFVVVVKKDGSVGHRRESERWDPDLPDEATVRRRREYLGPHFKPVLVDYRSAEGLIPRIILGNGRQ